LALLHWHHIPDRRHVHPYLGFVYRLVSGITRPPENELRRKDCEISLWSTAPKYMRAELGKDPHHSFLLPPRVVYNNKMNGYIADIQIV
jgi:hypothetical protein